VLDNEGIQPTDLWNMDETGFRIGVGKNQFVITKRRRQHYLGVPENLESATAIEAISASGGYIPAFLILSGQMHQAQWYRIPELDPHTKLVTSESGYLMTRLALSSYVISKSLQLPSNKVTNGY
jgi:hypothetical protein